MERAGAEGRTPGREGPGSVLLVNAGADQDVVHPLDITGF